MLLVLFVKFLVGGCELGGWSWNCELEGGLRNVQDTRKE